MKKIISLIFMLALMVSMFSQTATTGPFAYPRWGTATGTTVSSGNTGATLNYRNYTKTCAPKVNDTINLAPFAYETYINIASLDTLVINISSTANLYKGDRLIIYGTASKSGQRVICAGTTFLGTTSNPDTITTSGTFKCYLSFVWDGANFIELSRKRY